MILASFSVPRRRFLRTRLLLSTALIGVGVLMSPGGVMAQEFEDADSLYFDNTFGMDSGSVILEPKSGDWDADDDGRFDDDDDYDIWRKKNEDGSWDGAENITDEHYGILTEGADGDTVEIELVGGHRAVRGLRMESGAYTITGGALSGIDTSDENLVLDNHTGDPGSEFVIYSHIAGAVKIDGTGAGTGAVVFAGDTTINTDSDLNLKRIDVREGGLFKVSGRLNGVVVNTGHTVFETRVDEDGVEGVEGVAPVLGGTFHNGGVNADLGGTLDILGRAQINVLQNNVDGIVNIVNEEDHLTAGTDSKPVGVNNLGTVNLAGTIKSPDFLNSGTGILNLSNDNDGEGPTMEGRLLNYGTISVGDNLSVTLTINEYGHTDGDVGNGSFVNRGKGNFALGSDSNLTIDAAKFRFLESSGVTVGSNLTLNGEISNLGTLTYLTSGDEKATINGKVVNQLSGVISVEGKVDAGGNNIENIGEFKVHAPENSDGSLGGDCDKNSSDGCSISNLENVTNKGKWTVSNSGSMLVNSKFINMEGAKVEVADGGVISAVPADSVIGNRGQMSVNGTGKITAENEFRQSSTGILVIDGGTVDAEKLINSGVVNIKGEGELYADWLTNNEFSRIDVNGGFVDAKTLNNSGIIRINVAENGPGTVESDNITNRKFIEVYGNLTAETSLKNLSGAMIEVFDGGEIKLADGTLTNRGNASIDVIDGGVIDAKTFDNRGSLLVASGATVAGATFINRHEADVYGNLTPDTTLKNTDDGEIKIYDGGIVTTGTIQNQALINVDMGAEVTAETELLNEADGTLKVDGGSIKAASLQNMGKLDININDINNNNVADLTEIGTVVVAGEMNNLREGNKRGVININGTSIKADVFENSGVLKVNNTDGSGGTVTVADSFTNNAGGWVALAGTALTAEDDTGALGDIYNSGLFNINVDQNDIGRIAADTVRNSGKLNVNGGLVRAAAFTNSGTLAIRRVETGEDTFATGKVTATSSFDNVAGGTVNVRGGTLTVQEWGGPLGTLTNAGAINILTTADGDLGVVKVDNVENAGSIVVDGRLNAVTSFSNNGQGIVRIKSDFLKTETFNNNTGSKLVLDGGKLFVMNAEGELQALTNHGNITVNGNGDQIRAATLTNDGGTINVEGSFSGIPQIVNEAGTISVNGRLDAGTSFQNAGTVINDNYAANVRLNGGLLIADDLINSGSVSGNGTLQGALENFGEIDLAGSSGLVAPTVDNRAGGKLSLAGIARRIDGGKIQITNKGEMDLDAEVTGDVANAGKLTAAGSISGLLNNSAAGTMSVADGQDLELTSASERAENFGTMRIQGRLTAENLLVNRAAGILTVQQGGEINGRLLNRGGLDLRANSTVNGSVKNHGVLNGAGTINGALTQEAGGTLNVNGSLAVGSLTSKGTTNLRGKLTASDVIKNLDGGEMNLDDATVAWTANGEAAAGSGNLLLNQGVIDVLSSSEIHGDLTNENLIKTSAGDPNVILQVTGEFVNDGEIRADGKDSFLTIMADRIYLLDGSVLDTGFVRVVGDLVNGTKLSFDRDRALEGDLLNGTAGTIDINAYVDGDKDNDGSRNSIENEGIIRVSSEGLVAEVESLLNKETGKFRIAEGGSVSTADVFNEAGGSMTIAGDITATSKTGFVNSGDVGLSGTMTGKLTNKGGLITLNGGTITGDVLNEATGTSDGLMTGAVTINGDLRNNSEARLAGSVQNIRNSGNLETVGLLTVDNLTNTETGAVNIRVDDRLDSNGDVENAGRISVSGTLDAGVNNKKSAVLAMSGGTLRGDVDNSGTLRGRGTIAGELLHRKGATLNVTGRLSADALINRGIIRVEEDNTLVSKSLADNQEDMVINGTFAGDIESIGDYTLNGRHDGSLISMGHSVVNGVITGDLVYQGSGGGSVIDISDTAEILGTFDLAHDHAIKEGDTVKARTTVVRYLPGDDDTLGGYTLELAGTVDGHLVNRGIVDAGADAVITGDLTNNGLVRMSGNEKVGDKLTVGGGLAGSGVYALDINLSEMTSDSIEIQDGPATGNYDIALNYLGGAGTSEIGRSVTLIDVASEFGAKNDFTYDVVNPQTIADEKVVYLVGRDVDTGDIEMASSANPNVGAIFGNVALTRSLIGAVVNRPTSPFVTGLAFDASDKPCGVGSWGRATGGTATVTGGTDNGSISVDSSVDATYYGMQAGTDFACFDNRFAGWSMSFGGFLGVNQGDTTQLFYRIDSGTGEVIADQATSVNETEFDQLYAGVYVTGTKGPFQVDLQYRHENTDFSAVSTGLVAGAGLDLEDGKFSSKGNTLSGSISYTHQFGDKGWTLIPSVGFAHTRSETDPIAFNDGSQLEFEDSETTIGFMSATIAKSFVQTKSNSAIYAFTTGTIYKDFADPSVSILTDPSDETSMPQRLTTDNLGTYGKISFGANYVKVLQPGPGLRPRQLSASARIDARSGGDLESVGVTGQIRLQF